MGGISFGNKTKDTQVFIQSPPVYSDYSPKYNILKIIHANVVY